MKPYNRVIVQGLADLIDVVNYPARLGSNGANRKGGFKLWRTQAYGAGSLISGPHRDGVHGQPKDEANLQPERVCLSSGEHHHLFHRNAGINVLVSVPCSENGHEDAFGCCRLDNSTSDITNIYCSLVGCSRQPILHNSGTGFIVSGIRKKEKKVPGNGFPAASYFRSESAPFFARFLQY